ncbi:MAG: glycosyltransferase family 39 protein, partial [Phycisphaerales bacterium JB038]
MAALETNAKPKSIVGWGLLLVLLYGILVGTSLGLQWGRTAAERDRTWPSESYDEVYFHRPVIETFAAQLPTPNLADYDSATTPGYHLVGAVLYRLGGIGLARLFFAACALLLPLLLYRAVVPRLGIGAGLLLASLLCLSNYVIAAATWITTDNLALLFVAFSLVSMLAALDCEDWRWLLLATLAVLAALLVRQVHLWLCGPLFISALMFRSRDLRGV